MRPEKKFLLEEIKEKMDRSQAMIIASYGQLNPHLSWNLHNVLREKNCDFEVVKKRILVKVANENGYALDLEDLSGNIGVLFVFGEPYETTKVFYTFNKDNEEFLKIISGRVEEKIYTANELEMLAKLPSQDEMRAQLLGLFETPMSQTLAVMESLITSVAYCLENKLSSK
ncbi:MAG: 50S ribosomal protein L10 [Parachlamydiales bacterium]|nr:50S ribosomal protein L10 [Parachlamydiales bacterium]